MTGRVRTRVPNEVQCRAEQSRTEQSGTEADKEAVVNEDEIT